MPVRYDSRVVSITQADRIGDAVEGTFGILEDDSVMGGAVTAQGTPDMTVAVAALAANRYVINDAFQGTAIAGGNVTITAADPTNPRIDLVVANTSFAFAVVAGTAAATPVPPALTSSQVELAKIVVNAGATSIVTGDITDRRWIVRQRTGTHGGDLASAAALAPGVDMSYNVTGTTGITSLPNRPRGWLYIFRFAGALTVTHNATSLFLIGAANRTTATDDTMVFMAEGPGNWREITRNVAAGLTLAGSDTTDRTTTSTTAVDLSTTTISIAATTPFQLLLSGRKTSGAAALTRYGLKLNTTVIFTPSSGVQLGATSATNQAEDGNLAFFVGARRTNYTQCGTGTYSFSISATGGATTNGTIIGNQANAYPTATLTSGIITALTDSGAQTCAVQGVYWYALPV